MNASAKKVAWTYYRECLWQYAHGGGEDEGIDDSVLAYAAACVAEAVGPLVAALEGALPYLRHSVKFYRFQRPGHEFWPNREEVEGSIRDVAAALADMEASE